MKDVIVAVFLAYRYRTMTDIILGSVLFFFSHFDTVFIEDMQAYSETQEEYIKVTTDVVEISIQDEEMCRL